jgi:hypothetical protein
MTAELSQSPVRFIILDREKTKDTHRCFSGFSDNKVAEPYSRELFVLRNEIEHK